MRRNSPSNSYPAYHRARARAPTIGKTVYSL